VPWLPLEEGSKVCHKLVGILGNPTVRRQITPRFSRVRFRSPYRKARNSHTPHRSEARHRAVGHLKQQRDREDSRGAATMVPLITPAVSQHHPATQQATPTAQARRGTARSAVATLGRGQQSSSQIGRDTSNSTVRQRISPCFFHVKLVHPSNARNTSRLIMS